MKSNKFNKFIEFIDRKHKDVLWSNANHKIEENTWNYSAHRDDPYTSFKITVTDEGDGFNIKSKITGDEDLMESLTTDLGGATWPAKSGHRLFLLNEYGLKENGMLNFLDDITDPMTHHLNNFPLLPFSMTP